MNRFLDIGIRTTTLFVVLLPFFGWWWFAMSTPYQSPTCEIGDYNCRIDALDAHQVP